MPAHILTIAQQKGGAGKTTLVAQLACAFAAAHKSVAVMDIDPQGSLSAWHSLRATSTTARALPIHLTQIAGWRLSNEIRRLQDKFDLVLVDSPPHAETEAKIAIRAARLMVVPVQPSPMDAWATQATIDLARAEGIPYLVVLNRVPPRARLSEAIRIMLHEDNLPIAESTIGNRVGFATSMMEGLGVVETEPLSTAAEEVRNLMEELLRRG